MGADSKIGWTTHTFNGWIGCTRVSPACGGPHGEGGCYAEALSKRMGLAVWGPQAPRKVTSADNWKKPLRWARAARAARKADPWHRPRVFCQSMSDVFEDRRDLDGPRAWLAELIRVTAADLEWLLLTKRPEHFSLMPFDVLRLCTLGVTVENQKYADERLPLLLAQPCASTFVSYEPALGEVDFAPFIAGIDQLVIGGESGPGFRVLPLEWVENTVAQCRAAGTAVYVKQDSGRFPGKQGRIPDRLWVQEFPEVLA